MCAEDNGVEEDGNTTKTSNLKKSVQDKRGLGHRSVSGKKKFCSSTRENQNIKRGRGETCYFSIEILGNRDVCFSPSGFFRSSLPLATSAPTSPRSCRSERIISVALLLWCAPLSFRVPSSDCACARAACFWASSSEAAFSSLWGGSRKLYLKVSVTINGGVYTAKQKQYKQ